MKLILLNLFERFDPSVYYIFEFQLNWMFCSSSLILLPRRYWLIPSRINIVFNLVLSFLINEFSLSVYYKKLVPNVPIFIGIITYIIVINFFRLFPYIFPTTSHLTFNLSLSLSLWVRFLVYSINRNPIKFFTHLVPYNSPSMLINFIVIIELIRYAIRPLTLSIRLSSNLISGHLILILLSNFIIKFLFIIPFRVAIENVLLILEISISVIQAYVFSILLSLYLKESE